MLNKLALLCAASTVVLLFAGGLVTTTASGDAVPDWWFVPISFGTLMPKMTGGVLYEHGHRLVASAVGLLTIVLAVALQMKDPRRWIRVLGWLALFAVCAQGTLGGLRVHHVGNPKVIAIIHAGFAQIFFGLMVAIATATSRTWVEDERDPEPCKLPLLAAHVVGACYLQIILGALRRHTGKMMHAHLAWAAVVLILILILVAECHKRGRFRRSASALGGLIVAQLALGGWTWALVAGNFQRSHYAAKPEIFAITGHLVLGGLVYGLALSIMMRAYRVWGSARRPPFDAQSVT